MLYLLIFFCIKWSFSLNKNNLNTFVKITMPITSIYYLTLFFERFHFAGDYTRTKDSFGSPSCCEIHVTLNQKRLQRCIGAFFRSFDVPNCKIEARIWNRLIKLNCLNIGNSDFCVAFCHKLTHYLCTMCYESISEAEFIERLWSSSYSTMLSAAMKLLDVRSLNAQTLLASVTLQLRAPWCAS